MTHLIAVIEFVEVAVVTLIGATFYYMPQITRPDLYFAVTVDPAFPPSQEGRAIYQRFRRLVLAVTLASIVLVVGLGVVRPDAAPVAGVFGVLWEIIATFVVYFRTRVKVLPYAVDPSTQREAGLQPKSMHIPGGWILPWGPFVILAIAASYLRAHWSSIPARWPTHWDGNGIPNGWATASFLGVYFPLLIAVATSAFLLFQIWGAMHTRAIRASGLPGSREERYRKLIVGFLIGLQYLLTGVFVWIAFTPLRSEPARIPPVGLIVTPVFAFVAVMIFVMVRMGQGGSRVQPSEAANESHPVGDRILDRYWKAGMFYANRQDPAIFVEARFGIGYTLNFGHPIAWLSIVLLFFAILVPVLLSAAK